MPTDVARHSRWRRIVGATCMLYAVAMLITWISLQFLSDRWWPVTLVMFGPRWVCALPPIVLMPAAAFFSRRLVWVPILSVIFVLGPLMGFSIPWRMPRVGKSAASASHIRILTCNIDNGALNPDALHRVVASDKPDIVALQAWSDQYRAKVFSDAGWNFQRDDELLLASRFPIRSRTAISMGGTSTSPGAAARYEIQLTDGSILTVVNVHLATPRHALVSAISHSTAAGSDMAANSDVRRVQFEILRQAIALAAQPIVMAGDFNSPPDSVLHALLRPRMQDAFGVAGWGWGYTHFTRRTALRIDRVLADSALHVRNCWVSENVGSAHRPVLADIEVSLPARSQSR